VGWLIAALAAPVGGPLLYWSLHDRPRAVQLVDGFVYVAVPVLVAWQVLPHAWEDRNVWAVAALTAGFLLPAIVERVSHALADRTDNVALVVGISGLVLHAALEGAAFLPGADPVDVPFALAVTLHRIPVSLVVWWLICPRFGSGWAATGVGSIVLATLGGYLLGFELLGEMHSGGAELYQAFVSGSLVHVVYHQGRHDHDHDHGHGHGHAHGTHEHPARHSDN
jgi:hypothetical protein